MSCMKLSFTFFGLTVGLPKLKFVFSKKATKIDEIFTVNLTITILSQIDGDLFLTYHELG